MQIATTMLEMVKSGKVTVAANNIEGLEITAENNRIDINTTNKEFLKEALEGARDTQKGKSVTEKVKGSIGQVKAARVSMDMLKEFAEELRDAGMTVTLSYKGDLVVTMGSEANSKLSSIATGTRAIEINSPRKLIELGIQAV